MVMREAHEDHEKLWDEYKQVCELWLPLLGLPACAHAPEYRASS